MSEWKEFSAKSVEEALTDACIDLGVSSEKIAYEVVEKGSTGFLGLGSKLAVIKARIKDESEILESEAKVEKEEVKAEAEKVVEKVAEVASETVAAVENAVESVVEPVVDDSKKVVYSEDEVKKIAKDFLEDVFKAMGITVEITIESEFTEEESVLNINLVGSEMGILIGKRGGTLDSLQYLVGLVVNKNSKNYIKIKLDTENYRERRKATLENLAKNLAQKVKRTHKSVYLEPMNPYERRIIHYTLQNDEYVETYSEGEEPYRKVVIAMKPGVRYNNYKKNNYGRGKYGNKGGYRKNNGGYRKNNNSRYKKDYNKNYNSNNPNASGNDGNKDA